MRFMSKLRLSKPPVRGLLKLAAGAGFIFLCCAVISRVEARVLATSAAESTSDAAMLAFVTFGLSCALLSLAVIWFAICALDVLLPRVEGFFAKAETKSFLRRNRVAAVLVACLFVVAGIVMGAMGVGVLWEQTLCAGQFGSVLLWAWTFAATLLYIGFAATAVFVFFVFCEWLRSGRMLPSGAYNFRREGDCKRKRK